MKNNKIKKIYKQMEELGIEVTEHNIASYTLFLQKQKEIEKAVKAQAKKEKAKNQISARNIPNLYEGIDIDMDNLGCIMINTEKIPILQFIKDGEKDLVEATTRHDHTMGAVAEQEPHATLLYGLLENGNVWKDKVDQLLSGWSLPTVKIAEVSYFNLPESYAIVAKLEKTPELIDGHERLTLLPHINTFSGYEPHITLAYIKKEADVNMWVKKLGKVYDGQIVATNGINYGDEPETDDDEDDSKAENHVADEHNMENLPKAKKVKKKKLDDSDRDEETEDEENSTPETSVEAVLTHQNHNHEHAHTEAVERATNALNASQGALVLLQQANLENAIKNLDNQIVAQVMEQLEQGDVDDAEDIITEAQQEGFIAELMAILLAYYLATLPLYAAQQLALRLAEFGLMGVFSSEEQVVRRYVETAAQDGARSHVNTILNDWRKAAKDVAVQNPAYDLARAKTEEGASLQQISNAILTQYRDISKNRAKVIARNESARVFTMSQFQADRQFLTEANLMDRAYKRLRSRTDEPCVVCDYLIKKTTANPIPFNENFASLGQQINAPYIKKDGTKAVAKMAINYEDIKSGNVHVQCNCEYELVIKNDNGVWVNDISELIAKQ